VKNLHVNAYYFCFIFIILCAICCCDLLLTPLPRISCLWLAIALQSALFTLLLVFATCLTKRYCHSSLFYGLIVVHGLLLAYFESDLILRRLMGTSVIQFFRILLTENLLNIVEILKASNVPFSVWGFGAICLTLAAALWIVFYEYTEKFKKLQIKSFYLHLCCLLLAISYFFITVDVHPYLSNIEHEKYQGCLPLKHSFHRTLKKEFPFHGLPCLQNTAYEISPIEKKPPIFLFILESVGEKYIHTSTTPNLMHFKQNNISFETACSGGNATMISWYSIFHSKYSLHWSKDDASSTRNTGSYALEQLKKLGYKIRVYSSAGLEFYGMKESILGLNAAIADYVFQAPENLEPCDKDQMVMNKLCDDLSEYGTDGHLFITFLDSPHYKYSWPKDHTLFTPFLGSMNIFTAAHTSSNREKIFNRYQNSLHYLDTLMGQFFIKEKPENSVVVITGDHGQEFYEQGNLFHGSNLSREQINVPLYFSFGQNNLAANKYISPICSHIDIFPTLLDFLNQPVPNSLSGQSIFNNQRWQYTITSRYNGGLQPYEFCLQSSDHKMIFRFSNFYGWKHSNKLFLQSLTTKCDEVISNSEIEEELLSALSHIFE